MASTLTNSLLLLNEIRDHLKKSKGTLQNEVSPSKKFGKSNRTYRANNYDSEATVTSITTEEEPLRVQLNRRIDPSLQKSPPVSQKIRIENEGEGAFTETSYSKLSRTLNTTISPNKRNVGRLRENEDFNVEKFSRKSQQLADNLKRLINEEIENFSSECDSLRQKLQNMLDDKPSKGYSDSNALSKSTSRGGEYSQKEDASENKLNQITQKIEKLMEDIDEKKVGMSSTSKDQGASYDFDSFGGKPSPYKPRKSMPGESHSKY